MPEKQDNTRVKRPFVPSKQELTEEQKDALIQKQIKKNQSTRVYDKRKADFYQALQDNNNQNAFGHGLVGNYTHFDPTTEEGQNAIKSDLEYTRSNIENVAGGATAGAVEAAIFLRNKKIYDILAGILPMPSKNGALGHLSRYTQNPIGEGTEAIVVKNSPISVVKFTTIPKEEMAIRNSIPNVAPSNYAGYVKSHRQKMPTYIQQKMKILTEKTFPRYIEKLDQAMQKSGFRRIHDPNVQYRAYTNGNLVIDDISPDNVGLDWLRRPKIIDGNVQTVPEWLEQGFSLRNGGKIQR